MSILLLLILVSLLVLLPFRLQNLKLLPIFLGGLIGCLTFSLKTIHALDPITDIKNLVLAIAIFTLIGLVYTWYFKKIIARSKILLEKGKK
jgi:hypothetical protein